MHTETFFQHIDTDGRALLEAVTAAPGTAVTACPGWTNRDLATHLGGVYGFAIAQLRAANPGARAASDIPAAPSQGDIAPWFLARHQEVLTTLRATPPDAPAWNWTPNKTVSFFCRRMAHETAVHRWDAQRAAGMPAVIDADLAADGVEEVIEVALRHRVSEYPTGSLHLHRTDGEGEWWLTAADGTLTVTHVHAKGDATARGSAQALLLYLWGRGRDDLECHGDEAVLNAWGSLAP
jgi:uncharacterized protein (TIGR03083 family)